MQKLMRVAEKDLTLNYLIRFWKNEMRERTRNGSGYPAEIEGKMIAVTALNELSPHVKRRGRACRVKTLGWDSYLVTPPEQGKLKRLVHFDVSDVGVVKIECVAPETGEVCEANAFSKICSHVQAAALRLERNIKREEGRRAKADLKRSKFISKEVKKHPIQRGLL